MLHSSLWKEACIVSSVNFFLKLFWSFRVINLKAKGASKGPLYIIKHVLLESILTSRIAIEQKMPTPKLLFKIKTLVFKF